MPDDPLDAEKIRLLDQWAEGLQRDERAEVAAAGRAILMLIEEIERLHVHLWDQQLSASSPPAGAVAAAELPLEQSATQAEFDRTLRERLGRRLWGASTEA